MHRITSVAIALVAACTPPARDLSPRATLLDIVVLPTGEPMFVTSLEPLGTNGPDALRQYLRSPAHIETRTPLPDGFATIFVEPDRRELHVVREHHAHWVHCRAMLSNDAIQAAVLAACKRYKP